MIARARRLLPMALLAPLAACPAQPRTPSAAQPAASAPSVAEARAAGEPTGTSLESSEDPSASALPPAPGAAPALQLTPGALDAFFAGLRAAERKDADGRVLISIFGDSHTAGDRLTARLRQALAARFGDAGRGLVAMGKPPMRHYYQTEVRYGSSGKWKVAVGGRREDEEPFGLAGLRMSTRDRRAQSWVESCAECSIGGKVARFELLYWTAPGTARLRVRVDEQKWRPLPIDPGKAALRAASAPRAQPAHLARAVIPVTDGPHRLTVEPTSAGTVALFGVALERDRPGVIIDGLGVVGRTVLQLASWDWQVIGPQLAERVPRLVVLQYGTNEADYRDLDLTALAASYDRVIGQLRAAVPAASILLLGPPDMAVRDAGKACDPPKAPADRRASRAGKRAGDRASKRRAPSRQPPERPEQPVPDLSRPAPSAPPGSGVELVPPECRWHTPPRLLEIIAVQREVARRHGLAFFDTLAALGGAERMDAMVTAEPPLAFRDRVHLTALGYQLWAQALLTELLAAYEAWQPPAAAVQEP